MLNWMVLESEARQPLKMSPLQCGALVLCLPLLLAIAPSSGFFSWLTQSASPKIDPEPPAVAPDPASLEQLPFEMDTVDERFLAETQQVAASHLDSCHHKVVAQLRSTCTDLTEEELAKLGVSLFNCQASAEGRRTYLCTVDMTLAECTSEMDPDTWNAYHIVSNRARAVCYATRQVQFKRQAEQAVNTLASAAVGQLEAMKTLKRSQAELKLLTSESLQRVVSSQEVLLAQQEILHGSQAQVEESIRGSLEQLAQEKALVASGQRQVAEMIEGITLRMEKVSSHLDKQDMDLQEGHTSILMDLGQVQKRAQEVYSKIDSNLGLFLAYQNQTTHYQDELLGKLQKMNESFGLVLRAMEQMQTKVEGRLQHIQRFMSWAGLSLNSLDTWVMHCSYLLLAALIMTFLQISSLPRATLLVLVLANALSELHFAVSLGFQALTGLLLLAAAVSEVLGNICRHDLRDRKRGPLPASLPFPQKFSEIPAKKVGFNQSDHITSIPDREGDVCLLKELEKPEEVIYLPDEFQLETGPPGKGGDLHPSPQVRGQESRSSPLEGWKPHLGLSLHRLDSTCPTQREQVTLERLARPCLGFPLSSFSNPRTSSPNDSLASDASICSASPRPLCQGVTRTGQPCRKRAIPSHLFCHHHAAGQSHLA